MTAHTNEVTISAEAQESINAIMAKASPAELYTLAVMTRDAYRTQVRDNLMRLDPKLMRKLDSNVKFYAQFAH